MTPTLPNSPDREIERTGTRWMKPPSSGHDFIHVVAIRKSRSTEDSTYVDIDRDVTPVHDRYWDLEVARQNLNRHCRLLLPNAHEGRESGAKLSRCRRARPDSGRITAVLSEDPVSGEYDPGRHVVHVTVELRRRLHGLRDSPGVLHDSLGIEVAEAELQLKGSSPGSLESDVLIEEDSEQEGERI